MKKCRYCGKSFAPPHPDTTLCRDCWWSGRHLEEDHAALLLALRELVGDLALVEFGHMGGNCRALSIVSMRGMDYGRFIGTLAFKHKGQWETDLSLPDPGEPWAMGLYPDTNAEMPTVSAMPLTDAEVIAFVRKHRDALKRKAQSKGRSR